MFWQVLFNGVAAGCEYGLVAASLALVYQVRGFFNLGQGAIYAMSAYVAQALIVDGYLPVLICLAAAIACGVVAGLVMEVVVYGPLVRRGASSTILLIASLGLLIGLQSSVLFVFGSFTRTFYGQGVYEGIVFLGVRITAAQGVTIGVYAVFGVILWWWIYRTRSGMIVRAVGDNPLLSATFGIYERYTVLLVFAVASVLAAVGGILAGFNSNIFPTMGFWGILPGVVAVVVGGLGGVAGAFLGAMFIGIIRNLAAWFLPTMWQEAVMFAVLLGFLLLRPAGIVGTRLAQPRA